MSGICGIINLDGAPIDQALLRRMTELISHRGPDGTGYWTSSCGSVGLAHQMLCTTPESLHEKLPLENESKTLCLTFDGRVDNREELQDALKAKGAHLRDDTDAELVLKAYEVWGETSPHKILGDFAYAIWNGRTRQLYCARDILGLKPFYYYTDGKVFLFGSELRQLFEYQELPQKPNEGMIAEYLADQITSREETLWQGILRLPPAHFMVVEAGQTHRKSRYWDIDFSQKIRYETDHEYADHFLQIFKESVRCRMRSHKPVGAELSGGLDSSSVVCIGEKLRRQGGIAVPSFETFSLVFPGRSCDESRYIEAVARKWDLKANLVAEAPPAIEWYAEQVARYKDFADYPNGVMSMPLYQAAVERGVRVVLTGIGGDQWFEGHAQLSPQALIANIPAQLIQIANVFRVNGCGAALRHTGNRLRNALVRLGCRGKPRLTEIPSWVAPELADRTGLRARINSVASQRVEYPASRELLGTLDSGWTAHSNEMTERGHSAAGLEGRSPFFDRRIVQFAFAAPQEQRACRRQTKVVVRNAMRDLLPESVRTRPDKAEFGHTFGHGLANPGTKETFHALSLAEEGWVVSREVRRMFDEALFAHAQTRLLKGLWPLWMIYGAELWARRFRIDKT